jgi:hypothetical protein
VAEFYSASSGTIPPLPWQTFPPPFSKQAGEINAVLRGHYAYYGVAGNIRALFKVYRAVERYWRKMLCSRSWAGRRLTWDVFHQIKERTPLLQPKLRLPYRKLQALAVL